MDFNIYQIKQFIYSLQLMKRFMLYEHHCVHVVTLSLKQEAYQDVSFHTSVDLANDLNSHCSWVTGFGEW
jgi:hypothetical protein